MEKDQRVDAVLAAYNQRFKDAGPALLSLLYDVDLLPEQIVTMREAILFAACVEVFELGKKAAAESKWRLIESAPKDGSSVLLYLQQSHAGRHCHRRQVVGFYSDRLFKTARTWPLLTHWRVAKSRGDCVSPTHWQPLPSPPVQS